MHHRITRLETCDSTNEQGLCALTDGMGQHGDVLVAKEQTQGRGRRGNTWWSADQGGLYLSMLWIPPQPLSGVTLTIAGGLAVFDCVQQLGLRDGLLKWPNDLLVGSKKLAGVLAETRGFDPAKPGFVVGIGLNVLQEDFPQELRGQRGITSLALQGIQTDLEQAEATLIQALELRLEQSEKDPESLGVDFLNASELAQAQVEVHCAGQIQRGRILGLAFDSEPTMRLETGPAEETPLVAAHISALQRI